MPAKKSSQDKVAAALQKVFGPDSAYRLGTGRSAHAQVEESLSTGIDVVDHYLVGGGGLPIGRITELYGGENAGKTTFMYCMAGLAQRQVGAKVFVLDADHAFDETRAQQMGLNTEDTVVASPPTIEHAFDMLRIVLANHDPANPLLLCWDPLAASVSGKRINEMATKAKAAMGATARVTSDQFPGLLTALPSARAHLLMTNQVRVNMGVMFGDNTTTPGGKAPKFYATNRLALLGGSGLKNAAGEHTGKVLTFLATKTRFVPPFRKARVRLDFARGYNNAWTTLEWAKTLDLVPKDAKVSDAAMVAKAREKLLTYNEDARKKQLEALAREETAGKGAKKGKKAAEAEKEEDEFMPSAPEEDPEAILDEAGEDELDDENEGSEEEE